MFIFIERPSKNLAPTGIQSLDRNDRIEYLYWLSYPGPRTIESVVKQVLNNTKVTGAGAGLQAHSNGGK